MGSKQNFKDGGQLLVESTRDKLRAARPARPWHGRAFLLKGEGGSLQKARDVANRRGQCVQDAVRQKEALERNEQE